MNSSNNYVLITESQNLEEGGENQKTDKSEESETAALRALEDQGIFLEEHDDSPIPTKQRDQLSREIMDQSGIEIVPNEG